jgi:hypothetical protein
MSYRGLRNWPPIWTWRGGEGIDRRPRGEVGVLRDACLSQVEPRSRIYLIIEDESEEYMGSLLFGDAAFCAQICELLNKHRGSRIADLGNLDVDGFM